MTSDELLVAAKRKTAASARVKEAFVESMGKPLVDAAMALAGAMRGGGRVYTIGNGGSACDAQHFAVELMHPVVEKRRSFPASSLAVDASLLTAIGNDADFSLAFADQVRMLMRAGDALVGFSTSGDAANVCRAIAAAREMDALTIAIVGRDGGRAATLASHSLVVPSHNIHRIQETHTLVVHLLWDLAQLALGAEDVL